MLFICFISLFLKLFTNASMFIQLIFIFTKFTLLNSLKTTFEKFIMSLKITPKKQATFSNCVS
ncbi:hypothetical protein CRN67_04820 [Campylobacter blaseri]|uniref:Uncharacterized protein n=1 Tax=Campylobacter blaseri TaxID=2042961 RepID=A0A2P8R068_9BACT|nr:hypothetical protein CQ405_04820 [Campylobacter blaseri]PSM53675.1 hypothetical protein CRN67_04820 [Campylobacter blaseri]